MIKIRVWNFEHVQNYCHPYVQNEGESEYAFITRVESETNSGISSILFVNDEEQAKDIIEVFNAESHCEFKYKRICANIA